VQETPQAVGMIIDDINNSHTVLQDMNARSLHVADTYIYDQYVDDQANMIQSRAQLIKNQIL